MFSSSCPLLSQGAEPLSTTICTRWLYQAQWLGGDIDWLNSNLFICLCWKVHRAECIHTALF